MKDLAIHWRDFYRQEARIELQQASILLHTRAGDWDDRYEEEYRNLNHRAEIYLTKAEALDELLRRSAANQGKEI